MPPQHATAPNPVGIECHRRSYRPPQMALFEPDRPAATYREQTIEHAPLRRCGGCNRMLPVTVYCPAPGGRDGLSNSCPDCTLRNARIARGVDPRDATMRPSAGQLCELCGGPGGKKGIFLDHDHQTGRFRGWLCSSCNAALGHLQDDPDLVAAAVAYLKERGSAA